MIADVAEYPPVAVAALFEYLEESGLAKTIQPDDYVFTALPDYAGRGGYDPKRALIPQQVWRIAHNYGIKARLDRPVTTHTFRHTCARAMYSQGADVRTIQQKLRHRSGATTFIYLETLCSVSDPTIDRLNAKFGNL